MKVSIVTVCYNSAQTIEDSILSVINQTHGDIEYILVDGNSSDETLRIINKYKSSIARIVSEPDKGIYDAMNKGLAMATGEIVAFLNADDIYYDNEIIAKVVRIAMISGADCVYGDLVYVKQSDVNAVVRYWVTGEQRSFSKGWHPGCPAFFLKKDQYERFGDYRLDMKIAADFELMFRMLQKHNVKSHYLPEPLVKMRLGGISNNSWKSMLITFKDIRKAFKVNNIRFPILYPVYRYTPKILQYLKRS